jgi:hypothetical protein
MGEPYRTYFKPSNFNKHRTAGGFDSRFERSIGDELQEQVDSGAIKAYDTQFMVEMIAYRKDGTPAIRKNHKVDFRIHHLDNSFELLEAKGIETDDYKIRRQFLLELWLPEHRDHYYTVVKQSKPKKQWKNH